MVRTLVLQLGLGLGLGLLATSAMAEYRKDLEQAALACLEGQVPLLDDVLSEANIIAESVMEQCGNMLHAREDPFVGNDLLNLQNWQKIARPLSIQAVLHSRVKARNEASKPAP